MYAPCQNRAIIVLKNDCQPKISIKLKGKPHPNAILKAYATSLYLRFFGGTSYINKNVWLRLIKM